MTTTNKLVYCFEITKTPDGYQVWFKVPNASMLAISRQYATKAEAYQAIAILRQHAATAPIDDLTIYD